MFREVFVQHTDAFLVALHCTHVRNPEQSMGCSACTMHCNGQDVFPLDACLRGAMLLTYSHDAPVVIFDDWLKSVA
jgi:hypothetical protein